MSKPKCPNHGVEMDKTDNRRIWICPISGARFECNVETAEKERKIDSSGNMVENYKVIPLDGQGG